MKRHQAKEIIIGEGSGLADAFKAFEVASVKALAEKWNVKLVDLNKDEFVLVKPANP